MRGILTLSTLLICTSALAAEPAKLRTLAGRVQEGQLTTITDKEVVLDSKGSPIRVPLTDVLDLTLSSGSALPPESYSDLQLTDGTLLHCPRFTVRGDGLVCSLADGRSVKAQLKQLAWLLNEAQDPKNREEWDRILARKTNLDQLAVKDAEGKLNLLEGTFGNGDENAKSIEFESATGVRRQVSLSRIHAMSFVCKVATDIPSPTCKVVDSSRNTWMASKLDFTSGRFHITTAAGLETDLPARLVCRVDYSQGKIAYLSDLEPVKVVEVSNVDAVEHYRRDKNLDNGPLQLTQMVGARTELHTFAKGLALHATTELTYDIGGQYKEFKGTVGVDPGVGGDSHVRLVIEGDGRELFVGEVRRGDEPIQVSCDIKNVHQLRLSARPAGFLDIGNHANLADARLVK